MPASNFETLFVPHTICKWFSCDYTDVYAPILKYVPGNYLMIDKYVNRRTKEIIDNMNSKFTESNVDAVDLKQLISCKSVQEVKFYMNEALDWSKIKTIILTHQHTQDSFHHSEGWH